MIKKYFKFLKRNKLSDFDLVYKNIFGTKKVVIFDVGANFGQSIKRFEKYLHIDKYYSFEPLEECFNFICQNYKKNNYYHFNLAIGSKDEKKIFYVNNKKANSSFYRINKSSQWWKKKKQNSTHHNISEERLVQVIAIDNFLKNHDMPKIDIMKIDTQNHEDEVLLGLDNSLKNKMVDFIELEINVGDGYHKNLSFLDIEKILESKGYCLYGINNNGNKFKNSNLQFEVLYRLSE